MLVAFDEHGGYEPDVITTAMRLAARKRRGIHVLVTISVPSTSPIDARMPEQEEIAQSIIEEAKVQAGRRVSGHWVKVTRRSDRAADRRRGTGAACGGDRDADGRRTGPGSAGRWRRCCASAPAG